LKDEPLDNMEVRLANMEVEETSRYQPPGPSLEEAALFSRYILGRETTAEIKERYARACRKLFGKQPRPQDSAVVEFAVRHPWSLPFLDAAAGLVAPESLLRKKLFVVLAIVEATTEHSDFFSPKPHAPAGVIVRLFLWGVSSVLKLSVGLPLLLGVRLFSRSPSPRAMPETPARRDTTERADSAPGPDSTAEEP
jgi:hypothetical protein